MPVLCYIGKCFKSAFMLIRFVNKTDNHLSKFQKLYKIRRN